MAGFVFQSLSSSSSTPACQGDDYQCHLLSDVGQLRSDNNVGGGGLYAVVHLSLIHI